MTDTEDPTWILTDIATARDAAATAFDHARRLEDKARSAFDAVVGADQGAYVTALAAYQRASERVTRCSLAFDSLKRAYADDLDAINQAARLAASAAATVEVDR
jgi:hypothetical protein